CSPPVTASHCASPTNSAPARSRSPPSPRASTAGRWTTPPASPWRPSAPPGPQSRRSSSSSSTTGPTRRSPHGPADLRPRPSSGAVVLAALGELVTPAFHGGGGAAVGLGRVREGLG